MEEREEWAEERKGKRWREERLVRGEKGDEEENGRRGKLEKECPFLNQRNCLQFSSEF
jgi:hypothetical protein